MKSIQKYLFIALFTVILSSVSFFAAKTKVIPPLHFQVQSVSAAEAEDIRVFVAEDGNYYVFLPSYADMGQVTVSLTGLKKLSIGDVALSDGMTCGVFDLEIPYDLIVNNRRKATIWFYKSANVATIHIDTVTGSMDYVHENKNNKENASITIYTDTGEINHHSESNTLKGRGNATWGYEKRPYSLVLSSAADLLDMGEATNWVLLANFADKTNISNFLVHNLASSCGLPWTPECRYVDIYLNGEYNGLYLLAEKVEVGANRLNIDSSAGDFLCKFELADRCRNLISTNIGRTVDICHPQIFEQTDYLNMRTQINRMEQVILSGADLSAEEMIDLDSWVRRYLIDEISGNIDSDLASSYFYFSNGVFYAGPAWDYDMTFGNDPRNLEPNSFIAKNAVKSLYFLSPYYSALYKNESFYNRMVEIYRLEFLPVLQKLVDSEIQSLAGYIGNAAQMNGIRWKARYDALQNEERTMIREVADLLTYLEHRIAFLNHAWLENGDYCTIQFEFEPGEPYWNISVLKGSYMEIPYEDLQTTWFDSKTGEAVDFNQPIMKDMILSKQAVKKPDSNGQSVPNSDSTYSNSDGQSVTNVDSAFLNSDGQFATSVYITFVSIAMLLVLLAGFIIIDVLQRCKERRRADERHRTEVSP